MGGKEEVGEGGGGVGDNFQGKVGMGRNAIEEWEWEFVRQAGLGEKV